MNAHRILAQALALALGGPSVVQAVEPALFSTIDDGNAGVLMATPDAALPTPAQTPFAFPGGARPHGAAFIRGGNEALFAEFAGPLLYRAALSAPGTVTQLSLTGRTSANGTLASTPDGRFALSIGESTGGLGEAVVVDFASEPPAIAPIAGGLRVLRFVTAAIDFAPDGRAFVCHTSGVSVLSPPYTSVDFTMPFPEIVQSPSMCRLTRDGSRLFVTRVLSESQATPIGVRTTAAPYSANSVFVNMPAPAGVQGLGPMGVSPDGQALIVGQQFVFPQAPNPPRARAFLLRAPFDASTAYAPITLPANTTGTNCLDGAAAIDCPGFEHIEVSADGSLAVLTGNSGAVIASVPDSVPAVFVRAPFDDGQRTSTAVQITPPSATPGRGAGAVRLQPAAIFRDGLETL